MKNVKNSSIGQAGEYLVASELCRKGLIATTFTRNMPDFDILALNINKNKEFRVQVKTIKSIGDWQLNAANFLEFNAERFEEGIQKIIGINKELKNTDYFVFVRLGKEYSGSLFYVVSTENLKEIIRKNYDNYLTAKKGMRPKNPKSTHTALKDKDLQKFKNNWKVFT